MFGIKLNFVLPKSLKKLAKTISVKTIDTKNIAEIQPVHDNRNIRSVLRKFHSKWQQGEA